MSQIAITGAPTPRRSARLSQAGSVTGQSVLTTITTGGTRQRKKGPLTKVKPRKSNAYGASGRVGAAEELSVSATGFAQAFQNQRGDAVARDDEDDSEDDVDELGEETPRIGGGLNGHGLHQSPSIGLRSSSRNLQSSPFGESVDITPSDDWLATSIGDTSKSFGLGHEAGMLSRPTQPPSSHSSAEADLGAPLWQQNMARRAHLRVNASTQNEEQETELGLKVHQRPNKAAPAPRIAVEPVNDLMEEEQGRRQREGLSRAPFQQHPSSTRQKVNGPQAVNDWLGSVEPSHEDEHEWPWWRIMWRAFWFLIILACLLPFLRILASPSSPRYDQEAGMVKAMTDRIFQTRQHLAAWINPNDGNNRRLDNVKDWNPGSEASNSNGFPTRLQKQYAELDLRVHDVHNSIAMLKDHLPDFVVVRKYPDGRKEITDEFWSALKSRVASSTDDAEWIGFLKNNREKLRGILDVPLAGNASDIHPVAVSRQQLVDMMDDQYNRIAVHVEQEIFKAIKEKSPQIKAIVQTEARQAVVDSIRLQTIAQSYLDTSYEVNLLKPNYFSPGLGAVVEPTLTSATFLDNPGLLSRFAQRVGLFPLRNPPKAALTRWEEPGDCWCSAPNPSMAGQAQLAVSLPRAMFPNQVTVEHLPKSMVPGQKITNAPRHIEFWVKSDGPVRHQYHNRKNVCKDGPAGWTCLGAFKYNIHASNHVQTFDLDAESSLPVQKTMIRVLSNWGSDHTCIYRARLHGRDADDDYEYKVVLNDPTD